MYALQGGHDQHCAILVLPLRHLLLHGFLCSVFLASVGVAKVDLDDVLASSLMLVLLGPTGHTSLAL